MHGLAATSRALGIVHRGEASRDCVQRAALAYVQTDGHQWLETREREAREAGEAGEAHEVKTLLDMQMEIRGIFDDRSLWRRV